MRTTTGLMGRGQGWARSLVGATANKLPGRRTRVTALVATVVATLAGTGMVAVASPPTAALPAPQVAVVSSQGGPLASLDKALGALVSSTVRGVVGGVGSLLRQLPGAALPGAAGQGAPQGAAPPALSGAASYRAGAGANPYRPFSTGYDISWPQCGSAYPAPPFNMAIVGVNDGRAFTANPCLASQARWAGQGAPSAYMNINTPPPGPPNSTDQNGPAGTCAAVDQVCLAFNYGYNDAAYSVSYANTAGVLGHRWWLDVELVSSDPTYWTTSQGVNASAIAGAITGLQARGMSVGIYSTSYQWAILAGGFAPRLPVWVGGAPSSDPGYLCGPSFAFGGGSVWFTQYDAGLFDGDYAC